MNLLCTEGRILSLRFKMRTKNKELRWVDCWGNRIWREFTAKGLYSLSKARGKDIYSKQRVWVGQEILK